MKKILITLSLIGSLVFAQEKAVTDYIKDAGNSGKAEAAKNVVDSSKKLISPEVLAEYYYTVVKSNPNNTELVIESFSKLAEVEGKTYYSAKNKDSKKTEYFYDKSEAENTITNGNYSKLKTATAPTKFIPLASNQITPIAQKILTTANEDYKNTNYLAAGEGFLKTYQILKAVGVEDGEYKYNAGIAFQLAEDYSSAIKTYKELISGGWTGEKKTFTAIIKGSSDRIQINAADQNNPLYTDVKVETSPSKEKGLYENLIISLVNGNQYDEALEYLKIAQPKFPNSETLGKLAGRVYHETGESDKFINQLKEEIAKNPNDYENQYNLGVLLRKKENATAEEIELAKESFKKAIELDPSKTDPLYNITSVIFRSEQEYLDKMGENEDEKTAQQKQLYKEYSNKRKALYKEALPYFQKLYELEPNDYKVVRNLRSTYSVLEMYDEEEALRPIEKKLKDEQRKN